MSKFARSRYNPFDKFAQGAKIPDGKSNQSIGVRSTCAYEITLPDAGQVMDVVIAPGLHQSMLPVVKSSGTAPVISAGSTFGEIAAVTYTGTTFTPVNLSTFPHKWRLVSAGIRFVLLNNSDENEGWWEAVRVSDDIDPDDVDRTYDTSSEGGSDTMAIVQYPYIKSKTTPTEQAVITSDNTYIAGRFKDMHQVTFKLNSLSQEHDFVEVDSQTTTPQSIKKLFDPSYDSINLRFHPRANGTDISKASKFVVHASYNYEIEYEPGTLLAKMASAGWGGSKTRASRGDTITPGVVTRSYGMKRKKGTTSRKSYKKKKTTKKRPTYTKKARRKTTKKGRSRK